MEKREAFLFGGTVWAEGMCVWQEASEDQAQPELWEALSQDRNHSSCFRSQCYIIAARQPSLTPSFPPRRSADVLSTVLGLTHHIVPCPQGHFAFTVQLFGPYLHPLHWVLLGPRAGVLCPLSALVQACHIVRAEESLVWLHEAGPLVSG